MDERDTGRTTPPDGHGIGVRRRGAVEIWTIDRPERRNALARATVREIGRLARAAARDEAVRVVVITGAGDKAFSAGADLKERRSMSEEEVYDFLALYRAAFGYLDRLDKPVVAAMEGVAFGGGLELALACDFRVMSRHAKIGLTEVSLAIIPGAGGTQRLTRLVGAARAKELILLSRRIDAEEALRIGLVNRLADEGQTALDAALAFCEPLAAAAPIAVGAALAAIDAAGDLPLAAGLLFERECYERTMGTEDREEALVAFAEKRAPVFKGR